MTHWQRNRLVQFVGLFALAVVLYGAYFLFERNNDASMWLGLFGFPFALGCAVQTVFDPAGTKNRRDVFGLAIVVILLLCVPLVVMQAETIICIAMALPFALPLVWIGVASARLVLGYTPEVGQRTAQASLLVVPLLFPLLGWVPSLPTTVETQTNEIVIDAPAHVIWDQIQDFPTVQPQERLWTVSHNILNAPAPIRSRIEAGVRPAEWTHEITYDEVITLSDAPYKMRWTIAFEPGITAPEFDPMISPASDQLHLRDGGYDLIQEGDTTRVILHTNYRLTTGFNTYVAAWGRLLLGDNHRAVLHVLKLRAEAAT